MAVIVRTFAREVKHLFHIGAGRGLTANARSRTFVPEQLFPNTCPRTPVPIGGARHVRSRSITSTVARRPLRPRPGPPRCTGVAGPSPAVAVVGRAEHPGAGGPERPDRSRRRPCLRRRGRDGPPVAHVRAEPGDSLWSIAERYHGEVDLSRYVDALIDLNGGTAIVAGQLVRLP